MTFIGRQDELAFLEDRYANNKAQLVVLYGRRRVGKTELLAQFARNKQHVFFASPSATRDEQLAAFSRQMFEAGAPAGRYLQQYSDWESALADIVNLPTQDGKRRLIIIDEFPYLAKSDSSLPSVLQNLWDHTLKDSNVMMVLCGSSMSFIEKEMLSEKSPLYGRATGVLKLLPMPYWDAAQFFPDYSAQDNALAYAILGGIPHYLAQFDPSESVENNIRRTILRRGMPLYSETEFLMHQEFREPATYNTILQAVALGATQLNDIAQRTMLSGSAVSTYLKNLMEVHIVEREFPVDAKPVEQSKAMRGLYQVSDSFFRFWYAFVGSNRSELEMGDAKGVYEYEIAPYLHDFAAASFERMCADWLRRKSMQGELGFRASHVGRWWDSTREIDVVAIDKTNAHMLVGECKFRNKPMDNAMLESLRNKSLALKGGDRTYYLFSLSGFDRGVQAVADRDPSVKLIGIDDLYDL